MKFNWTYGLIPLACVSLGACDMLKGKGKEPTGQVVATVDGDEITLTELRRELGGVNLPTPQARKAAEQQALQMIINRKVIAQAAVEQELDKTPEFAMQEQRAIEALQANTLQKKIADAVPTPTREEVERFMAANPDMFAQRKVFAIDQIRIAMPSDPKIMKEFEPLKTFEDVEAHLRAKAIPFDRRIERLDAMRSNPKLVAAVVRLPPNEVFVMPAGNIVLINRVRETQVHPFVGEPAVKYATEMLKAQRTQEVISKQFGGLIQQAKSTIKYNKQYQPTPPAKPAAPKAAQAAPKA